MGGYKGIQRNAKEYKGKQTATDLVVLTRLLVRVGYNYKNYLYTLRDKDSKARRLSPTSKPSSQSWQRKKLEEPPFSIEKLVWKFHRKG